MRFILYILIPATAFASAFFFSGCSHLTYSTGTWPASDSVDVDPDFSRSLDPDFQDFTSYIFMGNRVENFSAYFNKFYQAESDFDEALTEYRKSFIATYNKRLDSIGITPPIPASVKEKLDKSIERASMIIQFHKDSKYIDDAVLLIGKAYYFQTDYINSERKFNEFLQRLSSSELTDEALLYLGRTKIKLGKTNDGIKIFESLVKESDKDEPKSLAARELGILAYNSGDVKGSAEYFREAIEYSDDNVRKAENQFILARLSSVYKPESAAGEFKKVLDYSPDFDLTFFARLNYAKGLIAIKDHSEAEDELNSIRKKYRDFKDYTPLVDLEIANNLYLQGKLKQGLEKYYEVIVQYPNTTAAADAYYFLGKDKEFVHKDLLNALVNYRKASTENPQSQYYPESMSKSKTLERYFKLTGEISGNKQIEIPASNPEVERFRAFYNEEKGIEQPDIDQGRGLEGQQGKDRDGEQRGDGKGGRGGAGFRDSTEQLMEDPTRAGPSPGNMKAPEKNTGKETETESGKEESDSVVSARREKEEKEVADKSYNSYYELAELFMYDMNMPDSVEYYLKLLIDKYPEPGKKAKSMFMLGSFYRTAGKTELAEQTFENIIREFPGTVFSREARNILDRKPEDDEELLAAPGQELMDRALTAFVGERYPESLGMLKEFVSKYPDDTLNAKALFGIGWIYENKLISKDSAIAYYKLLKLKFPATDYYARIAPRLDYYLSLEETPGDTTSAAADSLTGERKETASENPDPTGPGDQGATPTGPIIPGEPLKPEEIEMLLFKADGR